VSARERIEFEDDIQVPASASYSQRTRSSSSIARKVSSLHDNPNSVAEGEEESSSEGDRSGDEYVLPPYGRADSKEEVIEVDELEEETGVEEDSLGGLRKLIHFDCFPFATALNLHRLGSRSLYWLCKLFSAMRPGMKN
jgi:hypothetical protein